jgi:proteic killer suppression protein
MKISFGNQAKEDIFNGEVTKPTLRLCPQNIEKIAIRKIDQLDSVLSLDELRGLPGNRPESLSGDRRGQSGIRINAQYRICFKWTKTAPSEVEIIDYLSKRISRRRS